MFARLFNIKNRTVIYDRVHKVTASFLVGLTAVAFIGLCHQLYKAKTEYLPDIRRRGKERLEAALAVRQSEAEIAEQERLAEKLAETQSNPQQS